MGTATNIQTTSAKHFHSYSVIHANSVNNGHGYQYGYKY
jgi:hypothetical protein